MIFESTGDIFDSGAEVLVNPVNCVGVMGAGLAKQFKLRYFDAFVGYKAYCDIGLTPGQCPFFSINDNQFMACLPTKVHWKDPSRLEWVDAGLKKLRQICEPDYWDIKSIAIPALGCGLGGLNWSDVEPLIRSHFKTFEGDVFIYGPI